MKKLFDRRTVVSLTGMFLCAGLGYAKAVDPAAAITAVTTICGFICAANVTQAIKEPKVPSVGQS